VTNTRSAVEVDHHVGRLDDGVGVLPDFKPQLIDRLVAIEAVTTPAASIGLYRFTWTGTGGSNWLKTLIPDAAGGVVVSGAVAAGNEGVGATPDLAGTEAAGLATVGEGGPGGAWLAQAVQSPIKAARAAFFIGRLLLSR
jgi:hypothetical protein